MTPGTAGVPPASNFKREPRAGGTPAVPGLRLAITLLLLLACARTNISRTQWQSMSPNEKTLYVRTLLGHEKTKEAKGGNDRVFKESAEKYVTRIDETYARGDQRTVDAIFEDIGSPR